MTAKQTRLEIARDAAKIVMMAGGLTLMGAVLVHYVEKYAAASPGERVLKDRGVQVSDWVVDCAAPPTAAGR